MMEVVNVDFYKLISCIAAWTMHGMLSNPVIESYQQAKMNEIKMQQNDSYCKCHTIRSIKYNDERWYGCVCDAQYMHARQRTGYHNKRHIAINHSSERRHSCFLLGGACVTLSAVCWHRVELAVPVPWWRHQMEAFSAVLAICAANSPVTGKFPAQRPVTRSIDVFFDLRLNTHLSKQSWGWWFETPSCPLWCHNNVDESGWSSNRHISILMMMYGKDLTPTVMQN